MRHQETPASMRRRFETGAKRMFETWEEWFHSRYGITLLEYRELAAAGFYSELVREAELALYGSSSIASPDCLHANTEPREDWRGAYRFCLDCRGDIRE